MPRKKTKKNGSQLIDYGFVFEAIRKSKGNWEKIEKKMQSYRLRYLDPGNVYTVREVERYLSDPKNVVWIEAKDLLSKTNDACVDGREGECIIATPGGDIALLAEAIISIGKLVNRHLDPFEIRKVFRWRVAKLGSFYFHTDEHALGNLMKSLNVDPTIKKRFKSIEETLEFLVNPESRLQISLMSHIFKTENIGCGHMKLMLSSPHAYGMSRKVLYGIIRAYFNMLWNGTAKEKKRLHFRVLKGDHEEGAVVSILVPGKVKEDTMIPAVRPTDGKMSMFIFHPQVSDFMHRTQAVELAKSGLFPEISKLQVRSYQKTMSEVLGEGLRETVSRLAFGLPQYSFEFEYQG